jgi:hypothetical protein
MNIRGRILCLQTAAYRILGRSGTLDRRALNLGTRWPLTAPGAFALARSSVTMTPLGYVPMVFNYNKPELRECIFSSENASNCSKTISLRRRCSCGSGQTRAGKFRWVLGARWPARNRLRAPSFVDDRRQSDTRPRHKTR